MWGTKGARWKALPFRIIPARGQVSEDASERPSSSEFFNVFHNDVARSKFANKTVEFSPQARALAVDACASSVAGNILAWESSTKNITSWQVVDSDVSDVGEAGNVGPVPGENFLCIWVDFYLEYRRHAGALQAQFKATNSAEKAADS